VLSIDGTFLIGNYEGTMLIAIGIDADRQLVSLAFVIVEKENNGNWGWFLHLIQKVVIGPRHEMCVINAICEVIPNYSQVHYRWCT
jgi:hypothetical protein